MCKICVVVFALRRSVSFYSARVDTPRAPLCKGSCREATEGLCGTIFRVGKCIGEKVRGNDFAVESSGFDRTSAKWGQNGHGTFGRWAHREVCHYNPSVSFADSSPYTGEPLPRTASAPLATAQTAQQISNLSLCGIIRSPYSFFLTPHPYGHSCHRLRRRSAPPAAAGPGPGSGQLPSPGCRSPWPCRLSAGNF